MTTPTDRTGFAARNPEWPESDAKTTFWRLNQRDLSTVHHALRMLAKFPSEKDEATRAG